MQMIAESREMRKLLNVLHRMARTARMNYFMNAGGAHDQADSYSVGQYNRILERIQTIDTSGLPSLFAPLPETVSWSTLSNACRDLSAYYQDEAITDSKLNWNGFSVDYRFDKNAFRPQGMPEEVSELGHFIREKIAEWQDRKRAKPE